MISHLVSSNFITKQSILGVRKCFKNEDDKKENLTQNLVINFGKLTKLPSLYQKFWRKYFVLVRNNQISVTKTQI